MYIYRCIYVYMYMYMYKYIQRQTKNRENTGGKPKVQKPTTATTALTRASYYFFSLFNNCR